MGKQDISSKFIIDFDPEGLARWLTQDETLVVLESVSAEFQFVARHTDSLLRVRGREGVDFLLLTEMQFEYDDDMPARLQNYTALAREKYKLDVVPVVVYFKPPPKEKQLQFAYHRKFRGVVSYQDFRVITLWTIEAEPIERLPTGLLPFIPFMRGVDEELLVQATLRIRQEPIAEELETILALFANMSFSKRYIDQLMRANMTIFEESPMFQEWLAQKQEKATQEALEQGREQGLEQGREQGLEDMSVQRTIQTLEKRFGVLPSAENLKQRMLNLSLEQLDVLWDASFEVTSPAEFESQLAVIESN